MPEWLTRFWPDFFAGLLINFRVAAFALFLGLLLGAPLGVAQYRRQLAELPAKWLLAVLACVPTFAALFFLINVIPSNISLGGVENRDDARICTGHCAGTVRHRLGV